MAVDVDHRLLGPVGLEDEVGLLLRQVALDDALLIDARDAVVAAQGRGEVLEDPLRGAGEPVELLLRLQVPVEEIAGVGLRPVAVFGDADAAAGLEVVEPALVGALAGGDLARARLRDLRSGGRPGCPRPIRCG